jgi:hypothetical protein
MRMAADSGTTFPFTAVTVVLLFLSTSFLGQRAFDLWRQADPDAGKQVQLSEPPVEARLWEDPLAAFSRYREKLKEICPTGANAAPAGSSSESRCRAAQPANSETFKAAFGGSGDRLTLIAAMLPGAGRRRRVAATYSLCPARRLERRRLRSRRQRTSGLAARALLRIVQWVR